MINHKVMANTAIALILFIFFAGTARASGNGQGAILSVQTSDGQRATTNFNPGSPMYVEVRVMSHLGGQHHHLLVLNIVNATDGHVLYDSHQTGGDIDFLVTDTATKSFRYTWPSNAPRGNYYVLIGYRNYPWDPMFDLQGDANNPPLHIVHLR